MAQGAHISLPRKGACTLLQGVCRTVPADIAVGRRANTLTAASTQGYAEQELHGCCAESLDLLCALALAAALEAHAAERGASTIQ